MIYPITKNYVPNWGIWEVVREVLQNALDVGPLEYEQGTDMLMVMNAGSIGHGALLFGESCKGNKGSRGQFGEGLKLAMLAAARLGRRMIVDTGTERWVPSFNYSEEFGAEVLHIDIEPWAADSVMVAIETTGEEWYHNYTAEPYGFLLNEEAGRVYVGGLFVCQLDNLKYAYNFCPDEIVLNRDRDIPSVFDVQYAATKYLSPGRLLDCAIAGTYDVNRYAASAEHLAQEWKERYPDEVPVGLTEQGIECEKKRFVPDWVAVAIRSVCSFIFKDTAKTPIERLRAWAKNVELSTDERADLEEIINELE